MSRSFDAIIVGAGQAGPALAGRLTTSGMNVALIERGAVGGTCVNTGCTPTKTMVASAYVARMASRADDYGVGIDGPPVIDMAKVQARAAAVSSGSRDRLEQWLIGMARLTLLRGHARFTAPDTIEVGGEPITAPKIFLNVGGRANAPAMPGLDQIDFLTNVSILELTEVPHNLVVIGGSYIGLEFAQMFRRFGAAVTVVEMSSRLIAREDPEISEAIREMLIAEGIEIRTNATCISFAPHAEGIAASVDCTEGAPQVIGSHVLLAIGRKPNTDDLGLDQAGVTVDGRGYIQVDEGLATNVPGIWALGDCNGRGAFTHTAYNDFEIVAANLLDGENRRVSDRVPAYALYTDPPLGRVGLTETQARDSGRPLLVSTRPISQVSRAIEKGETNGLMKVVADAETRKILGAAILGVGGDEAIHGLIDAMHADLDFPVLQWAVPIHPTVSELIPTLLGGLRPV
ncbi:FAD-containing oxidoreductase [Sphingomonas sp. So64.6b]|uniref:FAD-containing oxidoreductase n=1 Tax=Sphingomonas sp. So64.6b TaxID=2997354 RepID=UPI0015FFA383|nr:FAD-containing oxidoreductase [Sphingomonas sp. So64.6b]QNA86226.1 FAD-containing oxidoreductase [Sphingomonas sp. So64.6b]